MYFLIGKNGLIKNAILLANQSATEKLTAINLRANFLNYIAQKQSKNLVYNGADTQWISSQHEVNPYVGLFADKSQVNDMSQENVIDLKIYDEAEAISKLEKTKTALRQLEIESSDLKSCFDFFIHTVFSAPSNVAGGGSTSSAIGVIWANPQLKWATVDVMELLVHEFTHNMMFIDELCYQHYTNLRFIVDEENHPVSAILKKKRPLDKVLHALAVSTEVLSFRHHVIGHAGKPLAHPNSVKLIEQTLNSVESVRALKNYEKLLTPRAKFIIDSCEAIVKKISQEIQGKANVA